MPRVVDLGIASILLLVLALPAGGQPPPGNADSGEGTLPDITVRPEDQLPDVIVTPDDQPTQEGITVTPSSEIFAPSDVSVSYPDYLDLSFGQSDGFEGLTGILRGPGNLFDSPVDGSIVTQQRLREAQAPDMFHALAEEVGVLMQRTAAGQASPFVRGLTGQQVLLLIDGIRMNNSVYRFGPNQYFNTIDPGMVDHIEVVRGTSSVLWGSDAIGGAVNVVTRSPNLDHSLCCGNNWGTEFTEYFNTADSSSYSRLNVEGSVGRGGFFGGGSYSNVHDLDTGFDFGRQPGTNYSQYAGDIKWNYLIDDLQMLTFALQHFEQEDLPRSDRFPGFPGDLNSSNTAAGARFFDPQQRDLAYIRYQALEPIRAIDAVTFTASYHRQRESQTRGTPITRFQEIDVETVGLSVVAARELESFGRMTFGADWYHDDVDSPFGGTASGPIIPDDAYYERFGVFLNWDVPITTRWTAVAGVRYENIDLAGTPVVDILGVPTPVFIDPDFHDWVGQVGLVYELNPCVHLVGSISEGFRAPNLDELMGNNPNVLQQGMDLPSLDLMPEHAVTYELGVKANYDRLRTQTFVFWTDLENNIVPIAAGPDEFTRDNQDSLIQGVELVGEYLLDCGWSLYGNFWYTYGLNLVTDAPLSRIPPTQGIVGLRWRDSDLRGYFTVYTWLVRRQDRLDPVRDLSDERIPPGGTPGYATLNMRFGKTLGTYDQHRLSVSLENITDKDYLVHGSGVFGSGFTARLGYSWAY